MRRSGHHIHAVSLSGLPEVAASGGHDSAALMRAAGLDPEVAGKPGVQIPFEAFCRLLEACAAAWPVPDLGLRMAPYQHLEVLGPVALATRMEPTVRAALRAISKNLTLHSSALVATLEEAAGSPVAAIVLETLPQDVPVRQYHELALAVARNILEQVSGRRLRPAEVTFRHEDCGSARAAAAGFRCPVRFGTGRTALYFAAGLLDTPLERSDTAYHSLIRQYLASETALADASLAGAARREIARQMAVGPCTLDSLAAGLSMSGRSLQRGLGEQGESFRSLLDQWRRDRAMVLVSRTRLPLAEVSAELGYAEQSIFSSAFRRWYGISPLKCRKEGCGLQ